VASARISALLRWIITLQRAVAKLFVLREAGMVLLWGILIHSVTILLCLVLVRAAGIPVSFLGLCAVVPAVLFLSYLPVSIGGWGIREGGMALGLGLLRVGTDDAVFVGLALGAFSLASAFAGAFIWLITPMPVSLAGRHS
jgi:hypothetical protein